MQKKDLNYILNFLETEAQSCEWYAKGIILGKVNQATSKPEELFKKADVFRNIAKIISTSKIDAEVESV